MEKKIAIKGSRLIMKIPGLKLNPREKRELEASIATLNRQGELLGPMEPLDPEPAFIFCPQEREP